MVWGAGERRDNTGRREGGWCGFLVYPKGKTAGAGAGEEGDCRMH